MRLKALNGAAHTELRDVHVTPQPLLPCYIFSAPQTQSYTVGYQAWMYMVSIPLSHTVSAMRLPVDLHSYKYETQQEVADDTHLLLCSCSGSKSACFFLKLVLNHHSLLSQLDSNLLFASPPPYFFIFHFFCCNTFLSRLSLPFLFPYDQSRFLLGLAKQCTVDAVGCL